MVYLGRMDDAGALTPDQIRELESDLVVLREQLGELIAASEEGTRPVELDQSAVGRLSRMDAIQGQQIAKASRRNHQLRLEQVGQALRLIARDNYGYCRRCEEPIGYLRLKARPESPFCLRCQGARERPK